MPTPKRITKILIFFILVCRGIIALFFNINCECAHIIIGKNIPIIIIMSINDPFITPFIIY